MALMERLQKALGWPDPPAEALPVLRPRPAPGQAAQDERVIELPPTPSAHELALAKAHRDVRRFGLAIEQCTKGEARLAVLRADLTRAERRLVMLGDL